MDYDTLKRIVFEREFDRLLGKVENEYFDCKGEPYALDSQSGKLELAKDCAAFGNLKGGYVLVGVRTEKSEAYLGDQVRAVRGVARGAVDPARYREVLDDWLYPRLNRLSIEWVELRDRVGFGVLVIEIPEQPTGVRPILVSKSLVEERRSEIVFGYIERVSESSTAMSVVDLHRLLQKGYLYEGRLEARLDAIESAVLEEGSARERASQIQTVEERIKRALSHDGLSEKRAIVLTASPRQGGELRTIFEGAEGIRGKLERPPILRPSGWSMETLDTARIVEGRFVESNERRSESDRPVPRRNVDIRRCGR